MELRQLKYFVAIADFKSFTNAAAMLFVSQSAISQQIVALETELDAQLFIRNPHSVRLTAAGIELYEYARKILDTANIAIESVKTADRSQQRTARLGIGMQEGISLSASITPLIKAVQATQTKYPFVDFDVVDVSIEQIEDVLHSGEMDIVVARLPVSWKGNADKKIKNKPLENEVQAIAVAKKLIANDFGGSQPTAKDLLKKYPLNIMKGRSTLISRVSAIYKEYGLRPRVDYYNSTTETIMRTCFGYGITILPEAQTHVLDKLDVLAFFSLDSENNWNSRSLVWLEDNMSEIKSYLLAQL